jgi:hypothetical protein
MTKLIDRLNDLKATASIRKAQREEEERLARIEAEQSEIALGKDHAEQMIPTITTKILRYADEGQYHSTDITIQLNGSKKELTPWEAAYAATLTQHFEEEGLTVTQSQIQKATATGHVFNTYLYISW